MCLLASGMGLLALNGCGPVVEHGTPLSEVLQQDSMQVNNHYRLQPGDTLEVHHILDPDYSGLVVVAPDGRISVPGIPMPVTVKGMTVAELGNTLDTLYQTGHVLKRPYFSLNLRNFGSLQVFVGGEVLRPGYLELTGGERRVAQVIMAAGGFLPTARRNEVIVLRPLPDGQQQIFSVNMQNVLRGVDLTQNVILHPLDTVIVPKSDIASFDVWVDQFIRQALPVPGQADVTYTNNPAASILK